MLRRLAAASLLAGSLAAQVDQEPYPTPPSKKGLQVQMVDDALALGIHHAALNCNLGQLFGGSAGKDTIAFRDGEHEFHFARGYVDSLDAQIQPLSDHGVVVTLILLAIATGDAAQDALLLHPRYDRAAPNHMGACNTATADGRAWLHAAVAFLADRWSRKGSGHGRVWNWIVGNEVNSHWWWYNLGHADLAAVADAYEQAVRVVHAAVRTASAHARVFVSLEHHWTIRYAAGSAQQAFPGRDFLLAFAALARARGDFDWQVAFHPYPENLFECRFWNDHTAPDQDDAPRGTFHNLPVLLRFLARDELRCAGAVRRVILSEQGFHCAEGPDGERDQAAAFALAWWLTTHLDGIDALLLHRHVDHAREGGLRLGLWSRKPDSVCEPDQQRAIYALFRDWDGDGWEKAAAFALPVFGKGSWDELLPPTK